MRRSNDNRNNQGNFNPNNLNQNSWFKDGDFKNHILNEHNKSITENFINKIFKYYNFEHKVKNLRNFQIAMTHVSYLSKSIVKDKTAKLLKDIPPISNDKKNFAMPLQQEDYNTFEYYGDSVIHLALTQYLYERYPSKDPGFLTKVRTKIERAETLSFLSKKIGLDKYVVIGRNMELNNARVNDVHLTEDIFEAFIWALFLESTYLDCKIFIVSVMEKEIDFAEMINLDDNYKEQVMQLFHKMKWKDPKYVEKIEDRKKTLNCHDQEFVVCLIEQENNQVLGIGCGNTKSKAEQNAAYSALINFKNKTYNASEKIEDDDSEYYGNSDKEEDSDSEYFEYDNDDKKQLYCSPQEEEWKSWFKNGDYKNHMLNENNVQITDKIINNILKKYGINNKIKEEKNFTIAMTHISYLDKISLKEKTALLLKDIPPISDEKKAKTLKLQNEDNGRLCHLGNAILRLALTEYLCQRYSTKDQGFLTRLRTKIERAETLSELAQKFGLNKFAIIAKNMEINNSRNEDISLMKGIFESFIGAVSLENTYEDCKKFLINIFEKEVDFAELLNKDDNYKEKLMQYFHKMKMKEPQYVEKKIAIEENQNYNSQDREFIMLILDFDGNIMGIGKSNTKNKAEQEAAHDALVRLNALEEDKDNDSDYYGELSGSDKNNNSDSEYYEE
jgi:dsRNA-specific ribonuclease